MNNGKKENYLKPEVEECWKDIDEFEGYQISNRGNVRGIDRYITDKNGFQKLIRGRKRKLSGLHIKLSIDGKGYSINRINYVGKAFLDSIDEDGFRAITPEDTIGEEKFYWVNNIASIRYSITLMDNESCMESFFTSTISMIQYVKTTYNVNLTEKMLYNATYEMDEDFGITLTDINDPDYFALIIRNCSLARKLISYHNKRDIIDNYKLMDDDCIGTPLTALEIREGLENLIKAPYGLIKDPNKHRSIMGVYRNYFKEAKYPLVDDRQYEICKIKDYIYVIRIAKIQKNEDILKARARLRDLSNNPVSNVTDILMNKSEVVQSSRRKLWYIKKDRSYLCGVSGNSGTEAFLEDILQIKYYLDEKEARDRATELGGKVFFTIIF